MRELKFRAWEPDEKRMYYPDVIAWGKAPMTKDGKTIPMPLCEYKRDGGARAYKEHELMQYTGLKDKNGKEIYEGDILSYVEHVYYIMKSLIEVISYDTTIASYLFGEIPFSEFDEYEIEVQPYIEVIGNIHENPELLNKKEVNNG